MRIAIAANATHQTLCGKLLAEGFTRHGLTAEHHSSIRTAATSDADLVIAWGWRNGLIARAEGKATLIMERAYLRDRFHWFSLGFGGLNGQAWFPKPEDGGARWREHFDGLLDDPRPEGSGEYAVILGQVPGDAALAGALNLRGFYDAAARHIRKTLGLRVVIRPHPGDKAAGKVEHFGFPVIDGTLDEVLAKAAVAVAWNSNSLTDAALAGLPLLIGDRGAMTWPLGGDLRSGPGEPAAGPRLADRTAWSHRIAFAQWLPDEIASGLAWDHLRHAAPDANPFQGTRFGYWREEADSVHSPVEQERAFG